MVKYLLIYAYIQDQEFKIFVLATSYSSPHSGVPSPQQGLTPAQLQQLFRAGLCSEWEEVRSEYLELCKAGARRREEGSRKFSVENYP